ncbi:MAG: phosphate ABC transporter substrate-binding protein [Acidobacteria bacterium]|nr:phosphate ABC transporter substrate-binding protein [Acidobacteriota bacterium]
MRLAPVGVRRTRCPGIPWAESGGRTRLIGRRRAVCQIVHVVIGAVGGLVMAGCGAVSSRSAARERTAIQNIGSDTMVNLAQAWAEAYAAVRPAVSVEVSGGGSGLGVAALLNGTADIVNSSRHLADDEVERARAKYGSDPREVKVAYDALAIYVHPSNPIDEISLEELSEIYREDGTSRMWSDLGVTLPGRHQKIVRVSRQNNSGTYHYFREAVVGGRADLRAGSLDLNGSKDVVALIAGTPSAIGYSGIGYRTNQVKVLSISAKKGGPAVAPTPENCLNKTYPIARPMLFYVPPNAPAHVDEYIEWVLSPAGQSLVSEKGYVPLEAD